MRKRIVDVANVLLRLCTDSFCKPGRCCLQQPQANFAGEQLHQAALFLFADSASPLLPITLSLNDSLPSRSNTVFFFSARAAVGAFCLTFSGQSFLGARGLLRT